MRVIGLCTVAEVSHRVYLDESAMMTTEAAAVTFTMKSISGIRGEPCT